jgi:hypothetical protein
MAHTLDQFPTPPIDELLSQLATLERRLEDGYRRIEAAQRDGQDVAAWESFWIELLHQYEALADGLIEAEAA